MVWSSTVPLPGDIAKVASNITALTLRARSAGAPVMFVQHEDGGEMLYGSSAWELSSRLCVEPHDYRIRKRTPDSFLDTELQALLVERGLKHVVVCGYASEFCVDMTVRRAAANGYTVTIAADAHTTHDKPHADAMRIREHHNATLSNITSFGSTITSIPADAIDFEALARVA
jgi:nicotinamidase-related amidase